MFFSFFFRTSSTADLSRMFRMVSMVSEINAGPDADVSNADADPVDKSEKVAKTLETVLNRWASEGGTEEDNGDQNLRANNDHLYED